MRKEKKDGNRSPSKRQRIMIQVVMLEARRAVPKALVVAVAAA